MGWDEITKQITEQADKEALGVLATAIQLEKERRAAMSNNALYNSKVHPFTDGDVVLVREVQLLGVSKPKDLPQAGMTRHIEHCYTVETSKRRGRFKFLCMLEGCTTDEPFEAVRDHDGSVWLEHPCGDISLRVETQASLQMELQKEGDAVVGVTSVLRDEPPAAFVPGNVTFSMGCDVVSDEQQRRVEAGWRPHKLTCAYCGAVSDFEETIYPAREAEGDRELNGFFRFLRQGWIGLLRKGSDEPLNMKYCCPKCYEDVSALSPSTGAVGGSSSAAVRVPLVQVPWNTPAIGTREFLGKGAVMATEEMDPIKPVDVLQKEMEAALQAAIKPEKDPLSEYEQIGCTSWPRPMGMAGPTRTRHRVYFVPWSRPWRISSLTGSAESTSCSPTSWLKRWSLRSSRTTGRSLCRHARRRSAGRCLSCTSLNVTVPVT